MNSAGFAPDFPTFICKGASYKFFRKTVYRGKFNSWFQTLTQKDKRQMGSRQDAQLHMS